METLRCLLGGPPLRDVDQRITNLRREQHRRINQLQPWERDRWSEQRRDAWREYRPPLDNGEPREGS